MSNNPFAHLLSKPKVPTYTGEAKLYFSAQPVNIKEIDLTDKSDEADEITAYKVRKILSTISQDNTKTANELRNLRRKQRMQEDPQYAEIVKQRNKDWREANKEKIKEAKKRYKLKQKIKLN